VVIAFVKPGETAEEWIMANCDKKIQCKPSPSCLGVATPTPDYAHDAAIKCDGNRIVKNGVTLQTCVGTCTVGTSGPTCTNGAQTPTTGLGMSCQYSCKKWSCAQDEIQMSQACSGIDMVCCRVPENAQDVAGKTCYDDADCGDPLTNECKYDPVSKNRFCTKRTAPLTNNTQCTSLNIGFSCNYVSNGKLTTVNVNVLIIAVLVNQAKLQILLRLLLR